MGSTSECQPESTLRLEPGDGPKFAPYNFLIYHQYHRSEGGKLDATFHVLHYQQVGVMDDHANIGTGIGTRDSSKCYQPRPRTAVTSSV